MSDAPRPSPGSSIVELCYDFSSPWSYLGSTQIERVAAEAGAQVKWTPVLLGAVFKALGGPIVPLFEQSPPRQRYQGRDLLHWADAWGVPFRWPSRFPTNSVTALRVAIAAGESEIARVSHALYRAYWADDRDLTDRATLVEIVGALGLDGAALVARTEDPAVKTRLRENTDGAIARGLFGVPTFFIGEQLVFGQDRLEFVTAALRGEAI